MRIYEIEHGEKQQVMPGFSNEDVFNILKKNCSQAWAAMVQTKKLLLRGMHEYDYRPIIHAKTRIDRTTATLDEPREQIDAAFKKLGFKALRTNSISCSSSYDASKQFGNSLYIIVPKDGFSFTWSPAVEDFGSMSGGAWGVNKIPKMMKQYECNFLEELLVDVLRYTDKNFPSALSSGYEVSVTGEYYALRFNDYSYDIKEELSK